MHLAGQTDAGQRFPRRVIDPRRRVVRHGPACSARDRGFSGRKRFCRFQYIFEAAYKTLEELSEFQALLILDFRPKQNKHGKNLVKYLYTTFLSFDDFLNAKSILFCLVAEFSEPLRLLKNPNFHQKSFLK